MINQGKGWTWETLYDMPVYLRQFYIKQMIEVIEKENDAYKKTQKKSSSTRKFIGKP